MNQVVLTTVLIALLGTAIYMAYTCDTKEGFWMTPSRQVKAEKMFQNPNTQDFFQVPNFQGILSPRFSNVNYGADLRSKFPNYNQMGVPQDPLSEKPNPPDPLNYAIAEGIPGSGFNEMSGEGYQGANPQYGWQESKYLGVPKVPLDPHNPYSAAYTNGDYNQVLNMAVATGSADGWPTSTVAEPDQAAFVTQDGEMKQPRDIAYFDGLSMVELDPRFTRLTKGQKDHDLSVDLKFPKDGARDGILLFMAGNGTNDFQIVYVQDGKLIVNTKNSKPASFVLDPDIEANVKNQDWIRLVFTIPDEFKDDMIYFGGAPINQIPKNTLKFANDINLSEQFQRIGLKSD